MYITNNGTGRTAAIGKLRELSEHEVRNLIYLDVSGNLEAFTEDSFLFERDISGLQKCTTDYVITRDDSGIFSIVFTEKLVTTEHTQYSCRGITVEAAMGKECSQSSI